MKGVQAILFDFDGVILDSVDVKGWAFGKLFDDYSEYVDEIVTFHHDNGGMSRYEKFRYIYKNILKKPLPEKEFKQLCNDFSKLVYHRVLECDFVPGAIEFLRKYYKKIPLFIISATPQEEIVNIVNAKGLSKYFKGVFGSPTPKGVWVKKIINEQNLDPIKAIFVGDAMSDYNAAKEGDIYFVGMFGNSKNDIFKDKKVNFKIRNLFELDDLLSEKETR